jgi:NAD(P)-dependent dehydrogenase (short-subunit alcohol dehydrogenase family)
VTDSACLVFGASGGIGAALCRRLRNAGARVLLAGRNGSALAALGAELDAPAHVCDVTQAAEVEAAVAKTTELFGRVDGMALCVGSILLKPAHLTTDEDWAHTLALNLTAVFHVVRAAARTMARAGGSVVLVSSVAAQRGLANHEAIAAAKAGVEGLVRAASATYARQGLRFNAVAPGLTRTKLAQAITGHEAALKYSTALHPLGRLGEPDDVASALAWLLAPEQTWVTGQVIAVDGGLSRVQAR